MRFAFISGMSGAAWGGSETLWSQTAERLVGSGHEVYASVAKWPNLAAPLAELKRSGAKLDERTWVHASRPKRAVSRILRRVAKPPGWEPCWERIRAFRPNLICVSHGGIACGLDWMLRCLQEEIPYVSVAQANGELFWPDDNQAERLLAAYSGARASFFVAESNVGLFEAQVGAPLDNVRVVRNPFNVSWSADPPWPVESGAFRLACVGRLEPAAKGQDLLLKVLMISKWRARPLEVTLYGEGPCERSLKRLAESYNLNSRVHFGGHVTDVEGIWASHHALVLPSRFEGLPLSLIEAMLCGRTAIVTDVAGNAEPLEDNVTGFVANAATTGCLDEAMERAWQRRQDWRAMGKAAALRIRKTIPSDPANAFAETLLQLAV